MKNLSLNKKKRRELELHNKILFDNYNEIREKKKFSRYYQDYWMGELLNLYSSVNSKNTPRLKILDYCCGTCILFPHVNKRFSKCQYLGIDLSDKMLDVAKSRFKGFKNFKVDQQDGEDLKLKRNYFGLVLARGAIHHLPNPSKGLNEIKRVLKDNGRLIISEPTSNKLFKMFRSILYKSSSQFTPSHKSFTYSELKKLLGDSGFKIIKLRKFGLIAYPFGLPDILPLVRYVPSVFLKPLIKIDEILLKIPVIRNFYWTILIIAEKK